MHEVWSDHRNSLLLLLLALERVLGQLLSSELSLGLFADVAGGGALSAELVEGDEVLELLGDLHALNGSDVLLDGLENASELRGSGDVLSGGVALLGLALAAGEDNKVSDVVLQALDVGLESLDAAVHAAVVDGDADAAGLALVDAGSLELSKGEATSGAHADVELGGLAADDRAQEASSRARADGLSAGAACETAALLLTGLVEESLHAALPLLVEVLVRHDIVVFDHLGGSWFTEAK
eukprot:INCI5694.1.p1 GENE.INCI5694.1~~INCI5694.1.p1  ORF type:complete len:239 (-),score=57.88 INCI5694.1:31-747(-)